MTIVENPTPPRNRKVGPKVRVEAKALLLPSSVRLRRPTPGSRNLRRNCISCNLFLELLIRCSHARWSFLTNHAQVLLCIAHDPGARLRDVAELVGITERTTHDIVTDLVDAGYVVKDKDGRRNRYRIQEHLPLRDPISQDRTIGELLDLLVGVDEQRTPRADRSHHG